MRHFKFTLCAIMTILLTTACGDDKQDDTIPTSLEGIFNGIFHSKVAGADYAYDQTTATITQMKEGSNMVQLHLDAITGTPGYGENPASMMTDVILENLDVKQLPDGSYMISADPVSGTGKMRGTQYSFTESSFSGRISGKTLTFSLLFKFGRMPHTIEAEFEGTL